ncbi:hypothetical protein HHL21_17775 [Massilia sp. RP-1-19]|uniref:Uncharacterized protein n=1 Tax=Massilia polaris TaxID=2728846 RepID=A0A848HUB1_9BURK|nr:hypothetical protein [Massilia polaris]NML62893.1 hypothetical protein [Massilia polaris]
MSEHLLEPVAAKIQAFPPGRRHHHAANEDQLHLRELNPDDVVDHLGADGPDAASFGPVRETCPKCENTHLRLVLRQHSVRVAHLLCVNCDSCFDACYPDGTPALTI